MISTTGIGFGLGCNITRYAENLRYLGKSRYVVSGFKEFFSTWRSYSATVHYGSTDKAMHSFKGQFKMILTANHKVPNIANNEYISPYASI